ncbi:putative transporter slc-17.2 [Babylonia areolata]|uniref:putative transporter slc-17.2 n=1 Tax=Babylonia areolata TaxID=304850 RepID=UPI003FD3FC29
MTSSKQKDSASVVQVNGSTGNDLRPDVSRQISTQSAHSKTHSPSFPKIFSWRMAMALHMHLSLVLILMLVQNMPFALVCMLKSSAGTNSSLMGNATSLLGGELSAGVLGGNDTGNSSFLEEADSMGTNGTNYVDTRDTQFDWDSSTQGLLLSSTGILAFVMPLMVDLLSRKVGGKLLLFCSMLCAACVTMLSPLAARLSPYVLMALRMVIGLVGGIKFPLVNEIFSWWAPRSEKVTLVSFAYSGMNTASILVSLSSGYLCSIPVDDGWPFMFYVYGGLAVTWGILWLFTGSVKPEDHPFISEDEKQYIISTRHAMDKNQKRSSPPYRQILTSVPVWGCLIATLAQSFCVKILSSYMPMFFNTVLGFTVEQVGLISSVTFVVRLVGVLCWGQISNLLLSRTRLHTTACRKIVQCSGFYLSGAGLLVLAFVRDQVTGTLLVCVVYLLQSCASASALIVPLDMAPRYAGFLTGFIITVSTVITIPAPLITSYMIHNGTLEGWRNVFIFLAVIVFVGATCFLLMGSSKLQSWAKPVKKKGNPHTASFDMKERRVSVVSEGLPGSPSMTRKRFDFSLDIQPVLNFSEAKWESRNVDVVITSETNSTASTISPVVKTSGRGSQESAKDNSLSSHPDHTDGSHTNPAFDDKLEL